MTRENGWRESFDPKIQAEWLNIPGRLHWYRHEASRLVPLFFAAGTLIQ
jgi:hypothetical protein